MVSGTEADLVLTGGKVRTPAHPSGFAGALAVRGGVIAAVGSDDEIVAAAIKVMRESGAAAILGTRSEKGMVLVEASGCDRLVEWTIPRAHAHRLR